MVELEKYFRFLLQERKWLVYVCSYRNTFSEREYNALRLLEWEIEIVHSQLARKYPRQMINNPLEWVKH